MKISVNTETEEIAELRAAVAIIEDAIKRREGSDEGEEESYDYDSETQTEEGEVSSYESHPQQVEQPKVQERNMRGTPPPVQQQRTIPQSSQPQQNNKGVVRNIIQTLKDKNRGGPIQMTEILRMARDKRIGEDETRRFVQELQRESSI